MTSLLAPENYDTATPEELREKIALKQAELTSALKENQILRGVHEKDVAEVLRLTDEVAHLRTLVRASSAAEFQAKEELAASRFAILALYKAMTDGQELSDVVGTLRKAAESLPQLREQAKPLARKKK